MVLPLALTTSHAQEVTPKEGNFMAAAYSWLVANWSQLLLSIVAVDQILIGIFPQVPFFGSLKSILSSLAGAGSPPVVPPKA